MMKRALYGSLPALSGILVIFISVFLVVRSGMTENVPGVLGDTIKIGMIFDKTGPTVAVQGPAADGIKMYYKYVNDQGGINGRKLKWIHEDDRYTISKQVAAFKKLIFRDEVFTMLMGGSTGGLMALQPMIKKEKIPVLGAPTSDIAVVPPRRYYFTNGTSYEDEIKILFDYMFDTLKVKNPRIGLVRADTEHGKVGSRTANMQAKLRNIKLAGEEVVSPGALDATSQVLNLKMAKADYIVLHTTTGNAAAFIRSASRLKFNPMYLGTKYAGAEELIRLTGDASKNFHMVNSFSRWYEDVPGVVRLRRLTGKYYPKDKIKPGWFVQGWTHAVVLVEALKRGGRDLTREGLIKAFESFKDVETGGLTGPLTFGPGIRKAGDYVRLYKADVVNKRLVAITDWMRPLK